MVIKKYKYLILTTLLVFFFAGCMGQPAAPMSDARKPVSTAENIVIQEFVMEGMQIEDALAIFNESSMNSKTPKTMNEWPEGKFLTYTPDFPQWESNSGLDFSKYSVKNISARYEYIWEDIWIDQTNYIYYYRYYVYDRYSSRIALLCEADKNTYARFFVTPEGYVVSGNGNMLAFDQEFSPLTQQPELPEGWEPKFVRVVDNDILIFCEQNGEQGLAIFGSGFQPKLQVRSDSVEAMSDYGFNAEFLKRYGDYIFYSADVNSNDFGVFANGIYRIDLTKCKLEEYPAQHINYTDDYIISVADYNPVADDSLIGDDSGGAWVTLWREGEPNTVHIPRFSKDNGMIIHFCDSHYRPEDNTVVVTAATVEIEIPMDGSPSTQTLLFPGQEHEGDLVSSDGVYRAHSVHRGYYDFSSQFYSIYIKNTVTGKEQYLYHDVRGHFVEPLHLTDEALYRCAANEFYDLRTGKKLDFNLRRPEASAITGHYDEIWPYVIGYAWVPELDSHAVLRLSDRESFEDDVTPDMQLELYDGKGNRYFRWNTDFWTMMNWTGAAYGWLPKQVKLEVVGTHLLFTDMGHYMSVYSRPEEETPPRIIDLDLETMQFTKMAGSKWSRSNDGTIVTAELEQLQNDGEQQLDRVSFYKFDNHQLTDMFSISFQVDEHNYWYEGWSIVFDEKTNSVELRDYPEQGKRLTFYFTGALEQTVQHDK